ncbi:MAG TPA: 2TM domain-containing protein [Mycobacteriales bacterium]|nr:2TM domain-containing protein [Mycobacteriales bacterium]
MKDDVAGLDDAELRKQAIYKLRAKRGFLTHLLTYVLINGFLTLIWAITGTGHFYWPIFFIGFWGVFLLLNAWTAFRRATFSEADIQKQMGKMRASS